mmetsp:Transcript_35724/g.86218  ORF Transcript_35724/g.86218 Transcript_35724/m.86218 type:complete len:255 (-) Transcript_35724:1906-2670(-)
MVLYRCHYLLPITTSSLVPTRMVCGVLWSCRLLLLLRRLPLSTRWILSHLVWRKVPRGQPLLSLLLLQPWSHLPLLHWWRPTARPSHLPLLLLSPLTLHRRSLLAGIRPAAHVRMGRRVSRSGHVPGGRTALLTAHLLGREPRWVLTWNGRATTLASLLLRRIPRRVLTALWWSTHRSSRGRRYAELRERVPSLTLLLVGIIAFEDRSLDLVDAASESAPHSGASLPNGLPGARCAFPDLGLGILCQFLGAVSE